MPEPMPGAVRQGNWFVLLDPGWTAGTPDSVPPPEVIVGGWMLDADGAVGPFEPNPNYVPRNQSTPTDPLDALLRLAARGEDVGDQIVPTIRDTVVQIGCDENDDPVIVLSPDGVPCVQIVTAEVHRSRLTTDRSWPVVGSKLSEIVPEGTDILINPGGRAQFRLVGAALRGTD